MPVSNNVGNGLNNDFEFSNKAATDYDDDNSSLNGNWRFSQCFGDKTETLEVAEGLLSIHTLGDIISALSFNRDGSFMASGDRAGRVVLFEQSSSGTEFHFYTEFQSHESEFDYLKSLEINERINKIEWWNTRPINNALFLLSTNGNNFF